MRISRMILLLASSLFSIPCVAFSASPVNNVPTAITVTENIESDITGIEVKDEDGDLDSVKVSVNNGRLEINISQEEGLEISRENDKTVTLKGSEEKINLALETLSYKPEQNGGGADSLKIESTDGSGGQSKINSVGITVIGQEVDGRCTTYTKATNEGKHLGDLASRLSVGSVVNYSMVRYNLADKKSSFNSQAFGFGMAFRYYTPSQLRQAKTNSIKDVPLACRAKTTDLLNFNQAPEGELPKIGALVSLSPTFYVFKDKNENDLGTQLGLNFGFLNDFITVGVGWNLSGGDAGEWFVLAGPSVGFQF